MKCLRTEEGIYELESKEVSSWEYIDNDTAINEYGVEGAFYTIYYFDENKGHYSEHDGKGGRSCIFIEEKDILKQADTIKELCDGFYVQIDDWSFDTTHLFDNFEKAIEDFKDWQSYSDRKDLGYEIEVYAFIKTKKGLIYVAKMNNKEDLKLL